MTNLTYSLLMPTCNRPALLKRHLESLSAQTRLPFEVIVIDQSDNGESKQVFNEWNPQNVKKKYIHRQIKSLILARNAGLDLCDSTDLVAFFDDDIVLSPHFSAHLVRVFENDKEGVYAGGMGTIEGKSYNLRPLQTFFLMPRDGSGSFLPNGVPTFPHWKKDFSETEFLSGGITFWRRKIIQEYRYDERLIGYGHGDDVDVSYRISRKHKLFFEPKAVCQHDDHSPGRDGLRKYRRAWIQNMYYLAQKNKASRFAFAWCILGHFLRDLVCRDFYGARGDLEGAWNVLRGRIDTVVDYQGFKKCLKESS